MRSLRIALATWRSAWAEAVANRAGFWSQITIMVVNDLAWIVFWVLFFDRIGTLRGWDLDRLFLLFSVLTTSGGTVLGLLNNARRVGPQAAAGELDAVLALPVPPLAHLLFRRVEPVNLGDLVFGLVLFVGFGHPTPQRVAVFVFGVVCSVMVLTGFLILIGSTSFWVGRGDVADLGFQGIVLFANYPIDVFGGTTRLLLYTVVPAGFVSSVPAGLIDSFDPAWAVAAGLAAALTAMAGWASFTIGLRRYTSGSTWTRA